MQISDVRLTLYALLSSIETDIRRFLRTNIANQFPDFSFVQDVELRTRSIERYIHDHPGLDPLSDIGGVLEYFDFADAYKVLYQNTNKLCKTATDELHKRGDSFNKLASIRNRVMHSRPLLAGDFETVYGFVTDIVTSSSFDWSTTYDSFTRLSKDPSFVLGLRIPSLSAYENLVFHNLPVPDFDDTGFIGRSDDVIKVKKLLLGPNTVVSLIGEGGIGKSALLLKVLYDIVDMGDQCPFDAIVWFSAKTTVLTPSGIQTIRDAVFDLASVTTSISNTLGGQAHNTKKQIEEILEYFHEFRVLLALDNLETIVSSEMDEFLLEAQLHAKIAITSRIGLGKLEFPWRLQRMLRREATMLFRTHAHIRNIQDLTKVSESKLNKILEQLHDNPLAIKWFVHSVQAGKTPDEVLSKKDNLLEYCMSNVYGQLSESTIVILETILSARAHISEAELIYYSGQTAMDVRKGLNHLLASSFLQRANRSKGAIEEVVYFVDDLAREYLLRKHPPSEAKVKQVQRKRDQLFSSVEDSQRVSKVDEFSVQALVPRNRSERAVCPLLKQALNHSYRKQYEEALNKIEEAKSILPQYSEIYKISAFVKAASGALLGAEEDYKIALDLDPNNPRLQYFYAGFLLRYMKDLTLALFHAEKAFIMKPDALTPTIMFAQCTGYSGNYSKALELLNRIFKNSETSLQKHKKIIASLIMNFHRRIAEEERLHKKDYQAAINNIHAGFEIFDSSVRDGFVDDRIKVELRELYQEYRNAIHYLRNVDIQRAYIESIERYSEFFDTEYKGWLIDACKSR